MTPLVFMDTETTGLGLDDDIWEFAAIRRDEGGRQRALHLFIEHSQVKCGLLPESFLRDHLARYDASVAVSQQEAAERIGAFFRKSDDGQRPHVVGAVPNFDTERVGLLLSRFGYQNPWHYHLIDVENLAIGYLAGERACIPLMSSMEDRGNVAMRWEQCSQLPWDSDEISAACGVRPPTDERHTAMGDVRWAMALYDAITGGSTTTADTVTHQNSPYRGTVDKAR